MSKRRIKIGKQEIELMKLIYEKNIIKGYIVKYDELIERSLISTHIIDNLKAQGFVYVDENKNLFLTDKGLVFTLKYLEYLSKRLEHRDRVVLTLLLIIVTSFTGAQYLGAEGLMIVWYIAIAVFIYLSLQYYESKRSQLSKIEDYLYK